jgi:hypothetical protein
VAVAAAAVAGGGGIDGGAGGMGRLAPNAQPPYEEVAGGGENGADFEFSDDELRMGVKEAKVAFRSPALLRAWKRAKRAAARAPE